MGRGCGILRLEELVAEEADLAEPFPGCSITRRTWRALLRPIVVIVAKYMHLIPAGKLSWWAGMRFTFLMGHRQKTISFGLMRAISKRGVQWRILSLIKCIFLYASSKRVK
jgi:hypothetical protein